MLMPDFHTDTQSNAVLAILKRVKSLDPKLGAYIEHFYDKKDTIIIKLTNGIFKIKETDLEKQVSGSELSDSDLKKIAKTFQCGVL